MIADRVKDTSTSTGTGNFTLSGSPATGFQALSAIGAVGATFGYVIDGGAEWEVGIGTITAANTFSRSPTASSNAGSLVNFSAGTKTCFHTITASQFASIPAASDIAFSTTVPLTNVGGAYMTGLQTVSGALTFTPAASPVRGAYTFAFLKANGANVPDVSAFTEHGSSMGYLNTANILNVAQFFNLGGVNWVSWSQAAVPVAIVAPTLVTLTGPTAGVVNVASSNYTVNTDGVRTAAVTVTPTPVTGITFTPSSVTLAAGSSSGTFTATSTTTGTKTIAVTNGSSLTNPSSITLTVAAAATAPATMAAPVATGGDTTASVALTAPSDGGSAITGYTVTSIPAGGVDSNAGLTSLTHVMTGLTNGTAYTFTAKATNAVGTAATASPASNSVTPAAAVAYTRLTPIDSASLIESGTGPYTYTPTGTNFDSNRGIVNKSLASGVDGSLTVTVGAGGFLIGIATTATLTNFASLAYYFYATNAGGYTPGPGTSGSLTFAAGDVVKLARVGTTLVGSVARTATPTSFTTVFTWTGVPTTALYFELESGGSVLSNLTAAGLV